MIRTLLLVRHAQAEPPKGIEDFNRKLTAVGERDARHIGRWMASEMGKIDKVISSGAVRARATAEIIVEEFKQNHVIEFSDEIYEGSVRTLLRDINQVDPKNKEVLLVAHNPSISYLADYLTGNPLDNMMPASAVILEFQNMDWSEIGQNTGSLKFYQNPQNIE